MDPKRMLFDVAKSKDGNLVVEGDYLSGVINITYNLQQFKRVPQGIGKHAGFWVDVSEDGSTLVIFGKQGFEIYHARSAFRLPVTKRLDDRYTVGGGAIAPDGLTVSVFTDQGEILHYFNDEVKGFVEAEQAPDFIREMLG